MAARVQHLLLCVSVAALLVMPCCTAARSLRTTTGGLIIRPDAPSKFLWGLRTICSLPKSLMYKMDRIVCDTRSFYQTTRGEILSTRDWGCMWKFSCAMFVSSPYLSSEICKAHVCSWSNFSNQKLTKSRHPWKNNALCFEGCIGMQFANALRVGARY